MMRNMRRREAPAGAQVNTSGANRRATGMGNQARLRRLNGGEPRQMIVEVSHADTGVPLNTRDPTDSVTEGVATVDGGADGGAPAVDAGAPATPADARAPASPAAPAVDGGAPAAPAACECELASGPAYSPTGSIPVTTSGGRKAAPFSLAASFVNNPAANKLPSCCHVQQYIKWNADFATWNGGPPHSGFPAGTAADTWIEDRDNLSPNSRYGRRSGPNSQPTAGCGDEYTTGGRRDMLNGDTYCGRDRPSGPDTILGNFKFQLVVFKTGGTAVARSSVITVTWA